MEFLGKFKLELTKDRLGGQLGIIAILHTWGRTLPWHPHVHCVVPGAVIDSEGHLRQVNPKYLLELTALSKLYRAILLRIVRSHPDGPTLPKIDWSKQWVANCRACTEGPGNVLRYLARYTKRGPLGESQILSVTDKQIAFRYISHRTKQPEVCRLTPQEFLRRYLQHTPPRGFHRIRYYGLLAPGNRRTLQALRLALVFALTALSPVIADLKKRSQMRPHHECSQCGGRHFVHLDFTSPNRRAPPWSTIRPGEEQIA